MVLTSPVLGPRGLHPLCVPHPDRILATAHAHRKLPAQFRPHAPVACGRRVSCGNSSAVSYPTADRSMPQESPSAPQDAGDDRPSAIPEPVKKKDLSAFQMMRRERKKKIRREQFVYMVAAIGATMLMGFLAVFATYYRFVFLLGGVKHFPWGEFAATLVLVFCGTAAMEMYARFAHKVLWHDFKPGWALHKSHHEPRIGPFEANDLYAIANAVPAISLCAYGFFHTGLAGGLCFGCGLGITLFGIMYMFVHDGLVHKRFPVGPIANVPYLRRIAAAHKLHHSDKYDGFPWGMFLGLQELEKYPEALEEVEKMVAAASREDRKALRDRMKALSTAPTPKPRDSGSSGPFVMPVPA